MLIDLVKQVELLGNVDAILVGGDIAFKAARDEYETALVWIQQLAEISGCPKERIFVVPGNHDIDGRVISNSVPTQNVQHAIASSKAEDREWRLRQQLGDAASGQALLDAHAEYNLFAARFGCSVWPGKLFWHQDIPLDGVRIEVLADARERSELGTFGTRMEADAKSATKLRWHCLRYHSARHARHC